jgi:UDP-N-acetylmuramate dehydrogenase
MAKKIKPIVHENVPFSMLGSYCIGGPVRYYSSPKSEDEIKEVVRLVHRHSWPILVLGSGTNVLMKDEGFEGLALRPDIIFIKKNKNRLRVGAGILVSDLLSYAISHNLGGLEWAGGLPGTIGGAIRGNAGCFGGEIKDSVESVESMVLHTGKKILRDNKDCAFDYRSSIFKNKLNGQEVIIAATFKLTPSRGTLLKKIVDDHIRYRKERQPLEYPNIGSIFKNIDARGMSKSRLLRFSHVLKEDPFPVIPTAHLIAETGLKGVSYGGAIISEKHPNFIVNALGATASDVHFLIYLAQKKVKEKFDIDLEPEFVQI